MGVALFDLDGTLLDCNSGRLWVQAEWRDGRIGVRDAVWAAWWLARYSLGHGSGLDEVFRVAVKTLEGQPEEVLRDRIDAWFDREVRGRLRVGAALALQRHRDAGDRLVLATSGSIYAARAAIAAYGLDDEISTNFVVRDGRFTGEVGRLAVGDAKLEAAREWAARHHVDLSEATFYTDSATDAALLEVVRVPVAVNPDRPLAAMAAARGWSIVDWGAARLASPAG